MMLDPLAEVGIGMFMSIRVGRRQFMVDILRDSERGKSKENADDPQCHSRSEHGEQAAGLARQYHHDIRSI